MLMVVAVLEAVAIITLVVVLRRRRSTAGVAGVARALLVEPPPPIEYHITRHYNGREHEVYVGTSQAKRDLAWRKVKYFSSEPGDFHSFAGRPGQLLQVDSLTRELEDDG